jgi:hypothetical protein
MIGVLASWKRFLRGAALTAASILSSGWPAFGGGGLPDVSYQFAPAPFTAKASASDSAAFSSQNGDYASTGFANASARGGDSQEVHVSTGHETVVRDVKSGGLSITSDTNAVVFQKGDSLIGRSRTETTTKITVNGQTYIVAEEVAMAVARATQFGSSAAASVESGGPGFGNSYSGPVTAGKPSSR